MSTAAVTVVVPVPRFTPGRVALLVGCAYEIVALLYPKVPTITEIIKSSSKKYRAGKLLLWIWCGYITAHFLVDD